MAFQFEQLIIVLVWLVLAGLVWKIKNTKIRIALVAAGVLLFMFNPTKSKQDGMSAHERFSADAKVPDKVQVKTESFDDLQSREMNKLKKQSKEVVKDEIN